MRRVTLRFWCKLCFNANLQIRSPLNSLAYIVPHCAKNGRLYQSQRSIDRVRKAMHVYKDELGQHTRNARSRWLWHTLLDVDSYLRGQSSWLVNYAKRYRAELRVGTSITEGTANFFVNRRMSKSQQMRWSRRGADLLLQVRCAVYNGAFGSRLGHLFQPHANQNERSVNAA